MCRLRASHSLLKFWASWAKSGGRTDIWDSSMSVRICTEKHYFLKKYSTKAIEVKNHYVREYVLTACRREGCRFWKNAAASTGSSGFAEAAACLCCSMRCCARTSSCIAGGKAARNSGFTSTGPLSSSTTEACARCLIRWSLSSTFHYYHYSRTLLSRYKFSDQITDLSCSAITSSRMSSGKAAKNDGSTPSGNCCSWLSDCCCGCCCDDCCDDCSEVPTVVLVSDVEDVGSWLTMLALQQMFNYEYNWCAAVIHVAQTHARAIYFRSTRRKSMSLVRHWLSSVRSLRIQSAESLLSLDRSSLVSWPKSTTIGAVAVRLDDSATFVASAPLRPGCPVAARCVGAASLDTCRPNNGRVLMYNVCMAR